MTIPPPTAIPAMAPLPSCILLEELLVGLLVADEEVDEPPLEDIVAVGVAVASTEDSELVAVLPDLVPVGTLLKDVADIADVPPIWLTYGE